MWEGPLHYGVDDLEKIVIFSCNSELFQATKIAKLQGCETLTSQWEKRRSFLHLKSKKKKRCKLVQTAFYSIHTAVAVEIIILIEISKCNTCTSQIFSGVGRVGPLRSVKKGKQARI